MAVTLNGTNGLTFNDGTSQKTAASGFGFKNRIINGDMRIDQRANGAVMNMTGAVYGTCDRWAFSYSVASKFTAQQSTTAPAGFTNSMLMTSLSAYSVAAGDYFLFNQRIEGLNVADFGWGTTNAQPITISFQVRSSLTGTFGGAITNSAGNRSYPFSYSINAANTFETKTITIPGDTSGTWLTTNGVGLNLRFGLGVGSTYSAAAGSWVAGEYFSTTGATNVVSTNGATFYITGVQLEKGSTATSFDYRPYGLEDNLCKRYYVNIPDNVYLNGYGTSPGSNAIAKIWFPVPMRASPTMTIGTASRVTSVAFGSEGAFSGQVNGVPSATGTAVVGGYTASAEL